LREQLAKRFPAEQVLPDQQPSYVRSSIYLFGALTIASLILVIASGTVLAIFGPQ
jgi:ubiquinol-cytochrome c reductase cytochrome b subunit